jgi:hypothetical protein
MYGASERPALPRDGPLHSDLRFKLGPAAPITVGGPRLAGAGQGHWIRRAVPMTWGAPAIAYKLSAGWPPGRRGTDGVRRTSEAATISTDR